MAVCKTDAFGNLTQYNSYRIIDSDAYRGEIKIIDDRGQVIFVSEDFFHIK